MTRGRFPAALALCLAFVSFSVAGAQVSGGDFLVEARVALDAYRATVEARLGGVLAGTRLLAAQDAARSGETGDIHLFFENG